MFPFSSVPASVLLISNLVLFISSSIEATPNYGARRFARQSSCQRLQYMCTNRECIPSYNVCDGAKDCSDGSDETRNACSASGIKCPSLAFECSYGACIDRELRCNGQPDCADGSDEDNCTNQTSTTADNSCGTLKFKCKNGQCINRYDTCDGIKNCDDGSDETKDLCSELVCPSSSFQCDYGACLEPTVKCDGKHDCPDNSDEQNCPNAVTVGPTATIPLAEGSCRLPPHPKHGVYTAVQCSQNDPKPACRNIPGTLVSNAWVIKYSCNGEYSLNRDYEFSICENGKWSNELQCVKLCPPLKSLSVDVKCTFNYQEVPCDRPMKPETKATVECSQFYKPAYVPEYKTLYCLANGEWTYPLFQCTPVCGVPQGPQNPLIINGNPTKQGEFPWLAAIYYRDDSGGFEQRCGGTLITPHIVLTAAHCLVTSDDVKQQPSDLKVGLGKYYRDINTKEPSSVIADVKEVIVRNKYAGKSSNYALDIGVLDLVVSVQISAFVMPACVDWSNMFRPTNGAIGLVAGWGNVEEHGVQQKASETILSAQLQYIGYDECLKKIRAAQKYLLTHDKFCASGVNGSRVSNGDSGGGLTFVRNSQHFVIGIVSTKITGEVTFTLFTDITSPDHSTWLETQKNRLKEAHREL